MIGIYGGTFDPVHFGHLRTALEVKDTLEMQELYMIPGYQPPHRAQPKVTAAQRMHMLKLAIQEEPALIADDREIKRGGPSYMVDTLESFREQNRTSPLALIIGTDAFEKLASWYQWQRLFDLAHVVVMKRPGNKINIKAMEDFYQRRYTEQINPLHGNLSGCLYFVPVTQLDISATQIRNICNIRGNVHFLLPDTVVNYIKENKLYEST